MNTPFDIHAGPSYWNNAWIIRRIDEAEDDDSARSTKPFVRTPVKSVQCLPCRLPNTAFMKREARQRAPREVVRQLKRSPSLDELEPPFDPDEEPASPGAESFSMSDELSSTTPPPTPTSPFGSLRKSGFFATVAAARKAWKPSQTGNLSQPKAEGPWREPQAWEIVSAVERKDVMYLMSVRDRAFHLLLRKTGDATPLLHAMRIGPSHRDIAILLVGAMSRWVNNLQDEDMDKPKTKVLLKALRTNLKLAIDGSLQLHQSDLIASFLQTLVMSEGDRWLDHQIHTVSLALRVPDGLEGKPVETAGDAVRSFATRELGKVQGIAALDDYVANATADLVMMAAWSIVLESIDGEAIPKYYFARDDRAYKAFVTRLEQHKVEINRKMGKRTRWQLKVLQKALASRQETMRKKVEVVREELDSEGPAI